MKPTKEEFPAVEIMDPEESMTSLMPSMNVDLAQQNPEEPKENLISDEQLLGVYSEIMTSIREDKKEIDELFTTFVNMVVNDGDSTTSSKEAVVNLLKMKTDQADKMTKVADLMTRVKMKERDTFPKYLAANQNNTIHIGDGGQKRALLEAINKAKKDRKNEA